MARKVSNQTLNAIVQAVKHFPEGASLENILQLLTPSLPKRSLQRYLAILVDKSLLNALGKARARRYIVSTNIEDEKPISFVFTETPPANRQTAKFVPLSQAALEIEARMRRVHRPIQARHPARYNRKFLDNYRPNATYYLSQSVRNHLFEIGKFPDGDYPAGTYARQILSRLLIDLSWNSSRLEGNSYSLLETERLLETGEIPVGKESMETQMILNHKAAIEFLVDSTKQLKFDYTIYQK